MEEDHIALVQLSFDRITPHTRVIARRFYQHLFDLDPSLRSRFACDLREQERVLLAGLQTILAALRHPPLAPAQTRALAQQCYRHGVHSQHFTIAGIALLTALRESLGDDFTPELEVAWAKVYVNIVDSIQETALSE